MVANPDDPTFVMETIHRYTMKKKEPLHPQSLTQLVREVYQQMFQSVWNTFYTHINPFTLIFRKTMYFSITSYVRFQLGIEMLS